MKGKTQKGVKKKKKIKGRVYIVEKERQVVNIFLIYWSPQNAASNGISLQRKEESALHSRYYSGWHSVSKDVQKQNPQGSSPLSLFFPTSCKWVNLNQTQRLKTCSQLEKPYGHTLQNSLFHSTRQKKRVQEPTFLVCALQPPEV